MKKKHWVVLDKSKLVRENLCQGKYDYKSGGLFHGPFLAPKIINSLTIDKFGIVQEHKTFEGFNASKRLFDRFQSSNMIDGTKTNSNVT